MKKIFLTFMLILLVVICFCGCGNMSVIGIGNYSFEKVHVDTHHYSGCIEVEKWYENSTGIEVKTKDYENIFLSEGTYTLIKDKCPFCEEGGNG